jgi:hypothetical protein
VIALAASAAAAVYLVNGRDDGDDGTTTSTVEAVSTTPSGAPGADPAVDAYFAEMRKSLTAQLAGPEAIDCIVSRLRAHITPAEIEDIDANREPKTLTRKAPSAGDACGRAALGENPSAARARCSTSAAPRLPGAPRCRRSSSP